ncbi:MAG: DUF6631 family protein [Gammaproteobacteria bacterium]
MPANKHANDLEILAPELTITVGGREVTIREPSWLQALEWEGPLKPVIHDLGEAASEGHESFIDTCMSLDVANKDTLLDFMAFCGDVDKEWLMSLKDDQGRLYQLAFWRVMRGFFARRLSLASALEGKPAGPAGARSALRWLITAMTGRRSKPIRDGS